MSKIFTKLSSVRQEQQQLLGEQERSFPTAPQTNKAKEAEPTNSTDPTALQTVKRSNDLSGQTVNEPLRSDTRNDQLTATVNPPERSVDRHPKKEQTKRRSFDFYDSQLRQIRKLRAQRELNEDCNVSMSSLMREAVDLLLEKEGLK